VQRFVLHHDDNAGGADSGKVERHRFVFETDGPLTPEQQKRFEEMGKQWEKKAAEWQKMAKHQEAFALAMRDKIPEVSSDCAQANGSASRSWTDKDGRQHVVVCERVIRDEAQIGQRMAQQAQGHAMMSLRQARETIASNDELSDSVKREVLVDLDREIARLQVDH
jgi:hypothetical protein